MGLEKIEKILNIKIENVEEAQEKRFPLFDLTEAYKDGEQNDPIKEISEKMPKWAEGAAVLKKNCGMTALPIEKPIKKKDACREPRPYRCPGSRLTSTARRRSSTASL